MTEHVLKTLPEAWDAVSLGEKRFEVRRNDRFFQRGDTVVLRRLSEITGGFSPGENGRGFRDIRRRIGWMLQGGQFGVAPEYCVFQLEPVEEPRHD